MSGYPYEFHFLPRVLLAVILGAMLGYEREHAGRSAGLRTNLLVCMGAALMMVISKYFYYEAGQIAGFNVAVALDPSRIAAGIVTGIGFLGAGVIIKESAGFVSGLTTAATLWFNAGVGMACGAGMVLLPIFLVAVAITALTILKKLEIRIARDKYKAIHVDCDCKVELALPVLKKHFVKCNMQIVNVNFSQNFSESTASFDFVVMATGIDDPLLRCASDLENYGFVRQIRVG